MKMSNGIKNVIGIDNGVTGSWAVLNITNGKSSFVKAPIKKVRDYTKEEQHCNRIDWQDLAVNVPSDSIAAIERPMVDPKRFVATKSALRALEATLIVLEMLDIPYEFIDSKEWQKEFLSSSLIGHKDMKIASKEVGIKLFPQHQSKIEKHGDSDSLLIALYYKQKRGL